MLLARFVDGSERIEWWTYTKGGRPRTLLEKGRYFAFVATHRRAKAMDVGIAFVPMAKRSPAFLAPIVGAVTAKERTARKLLPYFRIRYRRVSAVKAQESIADLPEEVFVYVREHLSRKNARLMFHIKG